MSTLLTYAVSTSPIPLQVSTPGTITVVANNPGGYSDQPTEDYVAVTSIVLSFGTPGTDGDELTADASTIQVTPPTSLVNHQPVSWTVQHDGLTFTFTPPAGGTQVFPSAGLTFGFAGIPVNGTVGTVTLTITETAASPGDPALPVYYPAYHTEARTETMSLSKFPAGFAVSDLDATPVIVDPGGKTTLSWSGTAGATYTLTYDSSTVSDLSNVGTHTVKDLQTSTTFYLEVKMTIGTDTLRLQRERTVTVNNVQILSFNAVPLYAGTGEQVVLSWKTANAVRCYLEPNPAQAPTPVQQTAFPVTPMETTTYQLTAYDASDDATHETLVVTVDPNVITTAKTETFVGNTGSTGPSGQDGERCTPGGHGGPGGPGPDLAIHASLFAECPDVLEVTVHLSTESAPRYFLLSPSGSLTLITQGGTGGRGGQGGSNIAGEYCAPGGVGGSGGAGGKVTLTVDADAQDRAAEQLHYKSKPGSTGKKGKGNTSSGDLFSL